MLSVIIMPIIDGYDYYTEHLKYYLNVMHTLIGKINTLSYLNVMNYVYILLEHLKMLSVIIIPINVCITFRLMFITQDAQCNNHVIIIKRNQYYV